MYLDEVLDLGKQKYWTRFQQYSYNAMLLIKDKIMEREKRNAKRNKGNI